MGQRHVGVFSSFKAIQNIWQIRQIQPQRQRYVEDCWMLEHLQQECIPCSRWLLCLGFD